MNYKKALAILDLKNGYTKKELKKAYFYKILMYHPDKNKEHSDGVMFNKVKESYEYLNQENHTSGISNDDCKCQDGSRENEINQNMGYSSYLKEFLQFTQINKDLVLGFCEELMMKTQELSCKFMEKLEGEQLIYIYDFIEKYNHIFNFKQEFIEKLRELLKEKVNIYVLNPSIYDIVKGNVYKLVLDEKIYYIPLWQEELYYNDLIIKIFPDLDNTVTIDQNNNLIMKHHIGIQELFDKDNLEIILKDDTYEKAIKFTIPKKDITFEEFQIIKIETTEGIPLQNDNDIFNVDKKGNVFLHLYLHK